MEIHLSKFFCNQAGWDNSAQKLKNTNNLAVFEVSENTRSSKLPGASPPGPVTFAEL